MEIVIAIITTIIASVLIVIYNNKELVLAEQSIMGKFIQCTTIRKNTIYSLILSLFIGSIVFMISYLHYQNTFEFSFKLLCIFEFLIPVAYIDLKKQIIPNKLLLLGFVLFLIFALVEIIFLQFSFIAMFKYYGFGLLMGSGVFILCALLAKGSMGMGDIKLFGVLGLFLGWEGVFSVILFSILCVAIYGIIMIILKKKNRKSLVSIGPFALLGLFIAILLGV